MKEVECKHCHSTFAVDDSKRNWKSIKLCSDDCRRAVAAKKKREAYIPMQAKSKACEHCEKVFTISPSIGDRQKFCSRECYREFKAIQAHNSWAETREKQLCEHCNAEFLPRKFAGARQIYCSKKCQVAAIGQRHYGKYNRGASYQSDFKLVRPTVLERDKVCVLCGSDKNLHVHHLDNSGRGEDCNNSLDNLAVLCGDCHSAIHKVTLVKVDGEWGVSGRIFDVVGVDNRLPIF